MVRCGREGNSFLDTKTQPNFLPQVQVSDAGNDKFTADQCRIKWVGDRHPRFNRSEWKAPETQKLSAFVEAAMTSTERLSWVEITQKLGVSIEKTSIFVLANGMV